MDKEKFNVRDEEASRDDITIEEEAMEQESRLKPELMHLLPSFELQSIEGKKVSPWDFKEKMNILLFFFRAEDSDDWDTLALLKQRAQDFSEINTEIMVIGRGTFGELEECVGSLELPFHILYDEDGKVAKEYGVSGAAIFATDRFNMLRFKNDVTSDKADQIIDQAHAVIDLAELECPECGVTNWPEL